MKNVYNNIVLLFLITDFSAGCRFWFHVFRRDRNRSKGGDFGVGHGDALPFRGHYRQMR